MPVHIPNLPCYSPDSEIDRVVRCDGPVSPQYAEMKHDTINDGFKSPMSINSNATQPGRWSEVDTDAEEADEQNQRKQRKKRPVKKKASDIHIDDNTMVVVSVNGLIHHEKCYKQGILSNGKRMTMIEARSVQGRRIPAAKGGC